MYELITAPKYIDLNLEAMELSLKYKHPGKGIYSVYCGVGFDLQINIGAQDEPVIAVISVDGVYNKIRVYLKDEKDVEGDFNIIRKEFVQLISSIKEFIKEEKALLFFFEQYNQ